MLEPKHAHPMLGHSQWPDFPGFTTDVKAYDDQVFDLGRQLFWGFAPALGLTKDSFTQLLKRPSSQMMETLSNGRFITTLHHVRKVAEARYSSSMFCNLDYDVRIEPLPRRAEPINDSGSPLPDLTASAVGDGHRLQPLFDFEMSVASGSLTLGDTVRHPTRSDRVGKPLLTDGEFDWAEDTRQVEQTLTRDGQSWVRVFEVDVIETDYSFTIATLSSQSAEKWFLRESTTLRCYTEVLL